MKKLIGTSCLLSIPVVLLACYNEESGLADEDYEGPPLVTVKGTLSLPDLDDLPEYISLGVLWYGTIGAGLGPVTEYPNYEGDEESETDNCDGTIADHQSATYLFHTNVFVSVQSVQYELESLFEFTIPIYDLPPEEARIDLSEYDGKGWIAHALVIAFADYNGNGVFDRGTPDGSEDRILAASRSWDEHNSLFGRERTEVVFLDGELGPPDYMGWFDLYQPLNFSDIWEPFVNSEPEQGFNIIVATNEPELPPTVTLVDEDYSIELFPIDREKDWYWTHLMECLEMEIREDFNGPIQAALELDNFGIICALPEIDSSWIGQIEWLSSEPVIDKPCTSRSLKGWACFYPGAPVPQDWEEACSYEEI